MKWRSQVRRSGARVGWTRGRGLPGILLLAGLIAASGPPARPADRPESFRPDGVVWTSPSTNTWGSMPLGNGEVGLNVLVEAGGDLICYLAKSDAWDAHARLLKLGRLRLRLQPNPWKNGSAFRQELRPALGDLEIRAGAGLNETRLRIWVDAHHPVIRIEGESASPLTVRCLLEPWRTRERVLEPEEANGAETFAGNAPVIADPDTVDADAAGALVWFHRNTRSVWEATLRHQGMESWIPRGRDPLLNRTFGGRVHGPGFRKPGPTVLESPEPVPRFRIAAHVLTAQTPTAEAWRAAIDAQADRVEAVPWEQARGAHERWWREFWNRSWIRVSTTGPDAATVDVLNQGYVLQRFLNACAGRGAMPIKFNGSIFTVPLPERFDPDYRRWGGCYWFQNTRLPYWPMLASGDHDLMRPLFRMYREARPLALARTRLHFDHGGAYFPETMHFWGAWHNGEFGWGWDRRDEPPNRSLNQYIRFHWSGGLELLALMLDFHAFGADDEFLREELLPHAEAVLEFYAVHYPRQPNGRLLFVPSQALETWWETENPTPEVAGLHYVLGRLLDLPEARIGEARQSAWRKLLRELPPVPRRTEDGRTFVLPAEAFRTKRNMENPELYAVFPFRLFGVGKPELEIGRETFRRREFKGNVGWQQDDTQAAFLGLADEARRMLLDRASKKHPESRFPAFWGPNFDWIPDQTHGGNLLMTLQTMLFQWEGQRLWLLPAWPDDWDVDFRLHAPGNTVIEGSLKAGQWRRRSVTPESRERDLVIRPGS